MGGPVSILGSIPVLAQGPEGPGCPRAHFTTLSPRWGALPASCGLAAWARSDGEAPRACPTRQGWDGPIPRMQNLRLGGRATRPTAQQHGPMSLRPAGPGAPPEGSRWHWCVPGCGRGRLPPSREPGNTWPGWGQGEAPVAAAHHAAATDQAAGNLPLGGVTASPPQHHGAAATFLVTFSVLLPSSN